MDIFAGILHIASLVLLLLVLAVRPARTHMSVYELNRRAKDGDKEAQQALRREQLMNDVYSVQRVATALLLVIISFLGVTAYDWFLGILISLVIALEAGVIAHARIVQRYAMQLYEKVEPGLLKVIDHHPNIFRLIRTVSPSVEDTTLSSKDELRHLVQESGSLLSDDERQSMLSILSFQGRLVKDSMTPRAAIETIKKTEILGPVVMDDLHKKGHSRIPVIDQDLDHIVGILYVQDLLTIEGGKRYTRTVEKAMSKKVFYIKETQTLDQALAAFIKTKHHLFVVVNEFRETVGLLSLEDVMEALIGRQVIDEFDVHDDLRAVAARNSVGNNTPKGHVDV